jgi:hypothetical protein
MCRNYFPPRTAGRLTTHRNALCAAHPPLPPLRAEKITRRAHAPPAWPMFSGDHRQARQIPSVSSVRRLPGRTARERGVAQGAEHWQPGTRLDQRPRRRRNSGSPHGRGHAELRACTVVRNHARASNLFARWSAACQGAARDTVPPAGNMRGGGQGAPSRAASSEGAGARCGGDAATATRSLDMAESWRRRAEAEEGSGRQGGRARAASADGEPWHGLGTLGTTTNQPTGAYGGGGGFR